MHNSYDDFISHFKSRKPTVAGCKRFVSCKYDRLTNDAVTIHLYVIRVLLFNPLDDLEFEFSK